MIATRHKSNVVTSVTFIGLFAIVVIVLRLATGGFGGPSVIPACDSDFTRDLLKQTINGSPQARLGLKVLKIGGMESAGVPDLLDENKQVRHRVCVGDVMTNLGRKNVYFNMSWADEKRTEIYLEAPMLPF